jgi:hypothetical protein
MPRLHRCLEPLNEVLFPQPHSGQAGANDPPAQSITTARGHVNILPRLFSSEKIHGSFPQHDKLRILGPSTVILCSVPSRLHFSALLPLVLQSDKRSPESNSYPPCATKTGMFSSFPRVADPPSRSSRLSAMFFRMLVSRTCTARSHPTVLAM